MRAAIIALLIISPLALAIGGTQVGREATVSFGEEAAFKVIVSGRPSFTVEKPYGWEVKIDDLGKEYVSTGSSYQEAIAYAVRIKPNSPSGTVVVTAIEKGNGEGIRTDKALMFSFHVTVKSSVPERRESTIKNVEEREKTQIQKPNPTIPAGAIIVAIAPLLWLAARRLTSGKPKKSRFGIR